MMNTLFHELIAEGSVMIYMDDIAIHTARKEGETEEQHLQRHRDIVNRVLQILSDNDLFLNPEKCKFEQKHIDFLGVRVVDGTVRMEDGKVERVKDWSPPRNVREVRKFLGFTGYYRYFIQNYSKIARPLLDLTKHTTPWHWDKDQQTAFQALKDKMCSKPVLT